MVIVNSRTLPSLLLGSMLLASLTACSTSSLYRDDESRLAQQKPGGGEPLATTRGPAGINPPSSADENSLKWPRTLYREAERKFNNETNGLKASGLSGLSWVHTGEFEDDEIHFSESGLKNDEDAQSLLSFEGKETLKATLGGDSTKFSVGINERGTATVVQREGVELECRAIPNVPIAQLLCRETGSGAGTRYLTFKQNTFLRKITTDSD